MDLVFEHNIRQRAYEIWMAAGMVDGNADEHWMLAKDAVLADAKPAAAEAHVATKPVAAKSGARTMAGAGTKSGAAPTPRGKSKSAAEPCAKSKVAKAKAAFEPANGAKPTPKSAAKPSKRVSKPTGIARKAQAGENRPSA